MPSKSEAQRKAMEAAATGRSTLGIPKKVGKKFRAVDRRMARTAKKKGYKRKLPTRVVPKKASTRRTGRRA